MNGKISVKAGERGLIWLFSIDLEDAALKAFNKRNGTWPAQDALGVDRLDPDHVDVFPVKDLEGVGLIQYLHDGMGVPKDQLTGLQPQLDNVEGSVMVLSSRAFGGTAQSFSPQTPLRLLAAFSEDRQPIAFETLPSESAIGQISSSEGKVTAQERRLGSLVFLTVAATLALALVIWISS